MLKLSPVHLGKKGLGPSFFLKALGLLRHKVLISLSIQVKEKSAQKFYSV